MTDVRTPAPSAPRTLDRRAFLRRSGATGLGLAAAGTGLAGLLAACGSSTKTSAGSSGSGSSGTAAPASLEAISVQLSWIKNAEFSGEYIADTKGYYTQAGLKGVDLLTGGPTVAQDSIVAAGKAFVGISSPDITGPAVTQGADLVIVGAQYQKNPFAIMSLASAPLHTPQDMIGKRIGVQSTNLSVWHSFLKANKIDSSKVTVFPAQFDPTPLAEHQCDGWFSFITNEPIELAAQGVQTATFLLNDFNYPLVSETFMVQKSVMSSATDRARLKAFLTAEIRGWHDSLADPSAGPTLSVQKYGANLGNTIPEQTKESVAQNQLILDARTRTDGIFTITPQQIQKNISTLTLSGAKVDKSLFDTSVIDEIYAEQPALKTSPV
jgi:ABC-type nitrate/sulfonate/bicarbonate transport system substrate-binding protein